MAIYYFGSCKERFVDRILQVPATIGSRFYVPLVQLAYGSMILDLLCCSLGFREALGLPIVTLEFPRLVLKVVLSFLDLKCTVFTCGLLFF